MRCSSADYSSAGRLSIADNPPIVSPDDLLVVRARRPARRALRSRSVYVTWLAARRASPERRIRRASGGWPSSSAGWSADPRRARLADRQARRAADGRCTWSSTCCCSTSRRSCSSSASPRCCCGPPPDACTRSSAAPASSPIPLFAVIALRRRSCGSGTSRAMYDEALGNSWVHASSTSASPSPAACTGGTCSRRSAAARGWPGWARSCYMACDEAAGRAPRGSCSPSRPAVIYPFYAHHPHYWGL